MKLVAVFVSVAVGSLLEDEALLQSSKLVGSRFANGRVCTARSDCTSDECGDNLRCRAKGSGGETSEDTCAMVDDAGAGRGTPSIRDKWNNAKCSSSQMRSLVGKVLSDNDPLIPPAAKLAIDIVKKKQVCMDVTITSSQSDFSNIKAVTSAHVSLSVGPLKLGSANLGPLVDTAVKKALPSLSAAVESKVDDLLVNSNIPQQCLTLDMLKKIGGKAAGAGGGVTYNDVKQLIDGLKQDNQRRDFFNTMLIPAVNKQIAAKLDDRDPLDRRESDSEKRCTDRDWLGTCWCTMSQGWGVHLTSFDGLKTAVTIDPFKFVDQSGATGSCLENCQLRITGGITADKINVKGRASGWYKKCGGIPKVEGSGSLAALAFAQAKMDITATYTLSAERTTGS